MANERRLIDANTLQSELVERQYHDQTMGILHSYYPHFRDIVANQPTVNAVEVCFCKDCKYWEPIRYGYRTDGLCLCLSKYHDAERPGTEGDFFCAYGKNGR